jgi:flap endonuclease-1
MRHMVAPGQSAQPILEIDRAVALEGLGLTEEQFIDMCILCGCDYCPSIKGVGPKTSLNLVLKHGSIDTILQV